MKFTLTVRIVVNASDGGNAIGRVNDLLNNPDFKHEIITVAAGDKVGT